MVLQVARFVDAAVATALTVFALAIGGYGVRSVSRFYFSGIVRSLRGD